MSSKTAQEGIKTAQESLKGPPELPPGAQDSPKTDDVAPAEINTKSVTCDGFPHNVFHPTRPSISSSSSSSSSSAWLVWLGRCESVCFPQPGAVGVVLVLSVSVGSSRPVRHERR